MDEDGSVTMEPVAPVVPASDRVLGLFDGQGFENDPQSQGALDVADRRRNLGLGRYPPLVVAARSVPREPYDTGEVVDFVPILQVGTVYALVHMGPERGPIVRLDLQEVGN